MKAHCIKIRNEQEEEYYQLGFKAGQESMTEDIPQAIAQARKNGIREVVEWIEKHSRETNRTGYYPLPEMWQEQQKRWGL